MNLILNSNSDPSSPLIFVFTELYQQLFDEFCVNTQCAQKKNRSVTRLVFSVIPPHNVKRELNSLPHVVFGKPSQLRRFCRPESIVSHCVRVHNVQKVVSCCLLKLPMCDDAWWSCFIIGLCADCARGKESRKAMNSCFKMN